jgi:hypothetical protein
VEIDRETDWPVNLSFVRDYWLDRRGARSMPGRNDISPAQLKAQLPYLLLADVVDGGRIFATGSWERSCGDSSAPNRPENS